MMFNCALVSQHACWAVTLPLLAHEVAAMSCGASWGGEGAAGSQGAGQERAGHPSRHTNRLQHTAAKQRKPSGGAYAEQPVSAAAHLSAELIVLNGLLNNLVSAAAVLCIGTASSLAAGVALGHLFIGLGAVGSEGG